MDIRKFIEKFEQTAKPQFQLLKKDIPFYWSLECNLLFSELKLKLTVVPILVPLDYSKPFIIRTDASRDGLGGVLLQRYEDDVEKPIYFESRSLSNSKENYCIRDLEGKAVYHCVKKFKAYIVGSKYILLLFILTTNL